MPLARFRSKELADFMAAVLLERGLAEGDARLGAAILIDADLTGVDTHGIANFATHDHYAAGLRSSVIDPEAQGKVLRDSPVAAAWDGDGAFGPVLAHRAMSAAIEKAEASGIGMVTIRRARHFGANGYFAEMAARRGLVAMVSTSTPVSGMPPGARRPVVGPDPFAFAAPVGDAPPLVLDISMTAVAGTKLIRARANGDQVPLGWVLDADGNPTTDPNWGRNGGGMELLGGQVAGHKGYVLALMVDVLGILGGSGSGLFRGRPLSAKNAADDADTWTQGQFFAAWRIDLFSDPDEFGAEMARLADKLHSVPTRDGGHVEYPGERRARTRADRLAHGIPLDERTLAPLRELAEQSGVDLPSPIGARQHA